MKVYNSTSEAYLGTLEDVYFNPDYKYAPRGQAIREKLDYSFKVLNPSADPIVTNDEDRNRTIERYTKKEVDLYNSCSNRVEDFVKASKFWKHIANANGTVNSAYGYLIWKNKSVGDKIKMTPWDWALNSLKADKDTRQAVLKFSTPDVHVAGVKDFICTMHGNFLIRDNKLHLSIVMRSNDLHKGLVYDLSWFCSLIERMVEELKPTYPELECGSYTHTAHSMHIYERDEADVLNMLGL
jgi:thymidylate synthase